MKLSMRNKTIKSKHFRNKWTFIPSNKCLAVKFKIKLHALCHNHTLSYTVLVKILLHVVYAIFFDLEYRNFWILVFEILCIYFLNSISFMIWYSLQIMSYISVKYAISVFRMLTQIMRYCKFLYQLSNSCNLDHSMIQTKLSPICSNLNTLGWDCEMQNNWKFLRIELYCSIRRIENEKLDENINGVSFVEFPV